MAIVPITTPHLTEPEPSHPLLPLFRAYTLSRDEALRWQNTYERIAPTPSTLAEPDPLHSLTGEDRDRYIAAYQASETWANAAYQQYNALMTTLDNLGGI